ncbi:MAG: class I SAM-dependent methyltransferase [Sphingomonas sp.]|nr:class I SAM-dependent methyltransferase [Sphingomonas sp.]
MEGKTYGQDHWDLRYAEDGYIFGEGPNRFLERQAPLLKPGMRALAVADGEGRNSVWLAEQGLEVVATDISPVGIEKARQLAASRGVTIDHRQADMVSWDYPEAAFDVVVAIFIQVVGPADRAKVFQGLRRALRPGGLLLLEGYTPDQLQHGTGGPSAVENLYTEALLREAFAGLAIERLEAYEAELDEGPRHRGLSAVIDLVARKA